MLTLIDATARWFPFYCETYDVGVFTFFEVYFGLLVF